MKKIKSFISIMLAAVMALAMSMTAFAAEPAQKGATYQIYQIFTGTFNEKDGKTGLVDARWGASVNSAKGTEGELVAGATLDTLEKLSGSEAEQAATLKEYADLKKPYTTADPSIDLETGKVTYTELPAGYYLISGTVTYDNDETADTLYVVRVTNGTLEFTPKVGVPTVDKEILEGTEEVKNNEASIGDDVNYKITGSLPSNYDMYKNYYYKFSDTLSKGLTFNEDSLDVKIGDVPIKDQIYTNATKNDDGTTSIVVGIQDMKTLTGVTITSASEIVITYSAQLNTDAVIAGAGNPNEVILEYSNDPNDRSDGKPNDKDKEPDPTDSIGETPKSEVVTYTTELAILKTDSDHKSLTGATFTLTGNGAKVSVVTETTFEQVASGTGEYYKLKGDKGYTKVAPIESSEGVVGNVDDYETLTKDYVIETRTITTGTGDEQVSVEATVGNDGRLIFTGLGAGEYTLKETEAPTGYNAAADRTFTISYNNGSFSAKYSDGADLNLGSDNTLWTEVVNQSGSLLPSTGGIGTTIFYIVGAILVIGAGIILVAKKRMSHE